MALEGTPPDVDDPNLLPPSEPDRLERITTMLRRVRELKLQAEDYETRRKAANAELFDLTMRQLPELFMAAHTSSHGLLPEGNMPGYVAKLKPFYKANISAEWPPEQQETGFNTLRKIGGGDLIKNTITVTFGKGEDQKALALCQRLLVYDIPYTQGQEVHWGTLTSWLKEQHSKLKREFTSNELEAIGATVGHVVEVKQVKS